MKILVTGASGTLGRAVSIEALAQGHEVVGYSRDRSRQLARCPLKVVCETGDVADLCELMHVCRTHEPDAIVHCAAMKHVSECEAKPDQTLRTNILGTQNVIRAAEWKKDCPAGLVFVSSDKACDQTVYGISKLYGERLVAEWAEKRRAHAHSVRLGNLIGSNGSVLDLWRRARANGQTPRLDECGGQTAKRFAIHPWEAAKFILNIFTFSFNGRTRIYVPQMPVLDMATLCDAATPGVITRGDIDANCIHQYAVLPSEKNVYLVGTPKNSSLCQVGYSTHNETPLTLEQTKAWLAEEKRPRDLRPDYLVCS